MSRVASPPVAALVEDLPPVTPVEVTAQAGLMVRTDRKYLVPQHELDALLELWAAHDPGLRALEVAGLRRHRYESTYFDTPDLDAYHRAARGRRRRFKVRTRRYVDSRTAFTELKTRGARATTVKTRVPRPVAAPLDRLGDDDLAFAEAGLRAARLHDVDVASLRPVLRTGYRRSTLWLPASRARVTIDLDLHWTSPRTVSTASVPALAVVETKSVGGRGPDRVLWDLGHRPARISKYGTGLSLLDPDLPAHRWHRVRTRDLHPRLVLDTPQEHA